MVHSQTPTQAKQQGLFKCASDQLCRVMVLRIYPNYASRGIQATRLSLADQTDKIDIKLTGHFKTKLYSILAKFFFIYLIIFYSFKFFFFKSFFIYFSATRLTKHEKKAAQFLE